MTEDRFNGWKPPAIPEGKPTEYGWIVRHVDRFKLGHRTDIGAFTYIQAKNGVTLEDEVQIGSHCAAYSVSVATDLFESGLCLPSGTGMTEKDIERVADVVRACKRSV